MNPVDDAFDNKDVCELVNVLGGSGVGEYVVVGEGLSVRVFVGVLDFVIVGELVNVFDGSGVAECVAVGSGVSVMIAVSVLVAGSKGVKVAVKVGGTSVAVEVGVEVAVYVAFGVMSGQTRPMMNTQLIPTPKKRAPKMTTHNQTGNLCQSLDRIA